MTVFRHEIVLSWKKVCHKVSVCENCQPQCCKAFTCLSNRAQMVGGRRPLLSEIYRVKDLPPAIDIRL